MTYNIRCAIDDHRKGRHWDTRLPIIAEHLPRPSIVGFQEVLPNQLVDLNEVMTGYACHGAGRMDGNEDGEHVPIFYKQDQWEMLDSGHFWLSAISEIPGSKSWGNKIPRMCTWVQLMDQSNGKRIYIYNTHLDHLSWKSRRQSARLLLDVIKDRKHPSDPVILLGDFNCRPQSTPMKILLANENILRDSFYSGDSDLANSSTFNRWRMSKRGRRRIDYILVSPDLNVQDYEILCIGKGTKVGSDHNAVITTVDWV